MFVCACACVANLPLLTALRTDFEDVADGGFAPLDQLLKEVMLVSGGMSLPSTDLFALNYVCSLMHGEQVS